jgi:hypothetical protein
MNNRLNNGLNDNIEIDYSLEGNMEVAVVNVFDVGVVDVDVDIMDATIECSDIVLNPNETIEDIFQNEVACAIDTRNINIIKCAINNFGDLLDRTYIEWANQVIVEIVEDQFDELDL